MTDWFFPEGMNHHELFAGVPGVQQVMQAFARRVAGLGKLPAAPGERHEAKRREVDVLVVGAGPSGIAVAVKAAKEKRSVSSTTPSSRAGPRSPQVRPRSSTR